MKFKSLGITLLVISILLFTGCSRTVPIYNVQDTPYPTWQEKNVTQKDISKAIIKAGRSLTWIMQEKNDGHIQGTLILRSHTAIVDIYYDDSKFSIMYKDSKNLKHDGNYIHRNYNNWVINLTRTINLYLSEL